MAASLRQVAGIALLLVAIAFSFLNSFEMDYEQHSATLEGLRRVRLLDARLDAGLTEARPLGAQAQRQIADAARAIDETLRAVAQSSHASQPPHAPALATLLEPYATTHRDKLARSEALRTREQAYEHARAQIPALVADLARAGGDDERTARAVGAAKDIMLYALAAGPWDSGAESLRDAVERLKALRVGAPARALSAIDGVVAHAEAALRLAPEIAALRADILGMPTSALLEQAIAIFNEAYRASVERAAVYRVGLFCFSALLVLIIGLVFFRLSQTTRELKDTVRQLNFQKFALDQHAIVSICDARGLVVYANEHYLRYRRQHHDDVVGRSADLLGIGTEGGPLPDPIMAVVSSGRVWNGEVRHVGTGGAETWSETTIVPFLDRTGRPFQYVAIQTDITRAKQVEDELRRAKDRAEQATRAKSAFLANMSHELRTPLNAVIGYSEILIDEAEELGQDSFTTDLNRIRGAGKQLLALINDILDLSKIEAGKMELHIEEIDVAALVEDVQSVIDPLVAKNNNALVVRCPVGVGRVRSDVTKIRQVLFNLLSNASKFTSNGKITLTVAREDSGLGGMVRFAVADSGIGISAEQMSKIFEAFSQADASTTRQYGGTGLGLTISRHFATMLGGMLTVDSRLGEGATFTLLIPARTESGTPPSPAPAAPPGAARAQGSDRGDR